MRLGESFKQVSERLEEVHCGLGEMKTLAVGVGDLKKVLTNVKIRGGWSEVQLGALLEQMLAPAQYERNVHTNSESSESVEYAIKLPGPGEDAGSIVWLPVDSKFPIEDYKRSMDAQEKGDLVALELSIKLQEASNKMDDVGTRSRAVERQLRIVEVLPTTSNDSQLPDVCHYRHAIPTVCFPQHFEPAPVLLRWMR